MLFSSKFKGIDIHELFKLKSNFSAESIAFFLLCANLVFMTRAFALVNLIEFFLLCLFSLNRELRQRLFFVCKYNWAVRGLVLFLLWIALSSIWSISSYSESLIDLWSWRKLMLFPMAIVLVNSPERFSIMIQSLIAISLIFCIASWLGYFGMIELDRQPQHLLENHTTQGILFSVSALGILTLQKRGIFGNANVLKLVAWSLVVVLVLNNLVISTGRGGYVMLVTVLGILPFMYGTRPVKTFFLSIIVAFTALALLFSFSTPRAKIFQAFTELNTAYESDRHTSLGIRLIMAKTTIQMIEDSPLLGSGSGGFVHQYAELIRSSNLSGWRAMVSDDPHNQYLHVIAEYGLIGFFFLAFVLFQIAKTIPQNYIPSYSVFVSAIFVGTLLNCIFNGHISAFVEGRLFWIFTGAFVGIYASSHLTEKIYN